MLNEKTFAVDQVSASISRDGSVAESSSGSGHYLIE